jgi:hypothetical protein
LAEAVIMRTNFRAIAIWASVGLFGVCVSLGRGQPGPEDGGAVLRTPFDDPAPRPAARSPGSSAAPQTGGSGPTTNLILQNLTVDPRYAMNRDIQPTPDLGPWMVCVQSYVTKEAPEWARQLAGELRSNPQYRLPAYVFTYGLEERRREYERVKHQLDRHREALKEKDLPFLYAPRKEDGPDSAGAGLSEDLPLAYMTRLLKVQHIPVQCAVLVGGYTNEDAANRALLNIKNLPAPDENKIKMDIKFYGSDEDPNRPGKLKKDSGVGMYVNPFKRAFVCRNPSIKQEQVAAANDGMDMNVLRRLNDGEAYTLLNCKKPITLAIKQFQTFTTVQTKDEPNVLQQFGFLTRKGEGVDQAAHDAHNLVEYLRQSKLDAYVLHTKFSSVVTVGGFDSLQDPNLRAMEATLSERLPALDNSLRRLNQGKSMMFFPRPMPMKVPH